MPRGSSPNFALLLGHNFEMQTDSRQVVSRVAPHPSPGPIPHRALLWACVPPLTTECHDVHWTTIMREHVRSGLEYREEAISEGGNFAGKFSPLRKVAPPPPRAKFSRRVTKNFTTNSDEYCEFRHVQRCTRRREGTKMCLFATCSGCVIGMHWNAVLPRILKVPTRKSAEPTRK